MTDSLTHTMPGPPFSLPNNQLIYSPTDKITISLTNEHTKQEFTYDVNIFGNSLPNNLCCF